MPLTLTSPAFVHEGEIPRVHTCDGADTSPALAWSGVPDGAQSLALIVDDPDAPDPEAPRMTYVHWVLYDLPVDAGGLDEGTTSATLPAGTREGLNDWNRTGYGGPCPPVGTHRYFFKLYALDTVLGDLGENDGGENDGGGTPTKADLEAAMAGHVLAEAQVMGVYARG